MDDASAKRSPPKAKRWHMRITSKNKRLQSRSAITDDEYQLLKGNLVR
nr:hypothetical protein [Gilliamella apicola]